MSTFYLKKMHSAHTGIEYGEREKGREAELNIFLFIFYEYFPYAQNDNDDEQAIKTSAFQSQHFSLWLAFKWLRESNDQPRH